MSRTSGPRKTANLSESVHHQLNMYALAAGAAGVGALALTQTAEAKIVYTRVNKPLNYAVTILDLNNDGIPDFGFCENATGSGATTYCRLALDRGRKLLGERHPPSPFGELLYVFPPAAEKQQNRIWGNSTWAGHAAAAALRAGFHIGPKRRFLPGSHLMATWESLAGTQFYGGPWKNVLHRYLGLKFIIKGKIHYGWARLNVNAAHGIVATLTGYAYETIPNYPIIMGKTTGTDDVEKYDSGPGASLSTPISDKPQPTSLGMLALGAQGVPLWRRKETALQGN
jgi:hypothetical protein